MASKPKTYCSNPYGNKHGKLAKNKTFARVTKGMVDSVHGLIPELRENDFLCKTCNLRIYNFAKSLKEHVSLEEPETSKDSSDYDLSSNDSDDDDFDVPEVNKQQITKMLTDIHVSCKELEQEYVSVRSAATVYGRLKERLQCFKLNLQQVAGTSKDLSPQKAVKTTNAETHECKNCDDLLKDLVFRFQTLTSKQDKYKILTCCPRGTTITKMTELFGCSIAMARQASQLRNTRGAFTSPIFKQRQGLSDATVQAVKAFYLSDENSRVDPCLRRAVYVRNPETGDRELQAKRVLWMTLQEFHREFNIQHPDLKISVTSISQLRPKNVVWSGNKGFHNTCTCIIHENFRLLLEASGITDTLIELLSKVFCSTTSDLCMFGICSDCPDSATLESHFENIDEGLMPYSYWGSSPGMVGFQLLDGSIKTEDLKTKVANYLLLIASHHFVNQKQKEFIRNLKENVIKTENSAVLQVDYAQNYSFIAQNAVAGHHWSNNQATVHPFVLIWFCRTEFKIKKKSFVVVSNELKHDASTFFSFKTVVLRQMKKENLVFEKIYFVSDGCAGQYKGVKGFVLLMHMERDFGMKAEWHFFATSHGKSECDGIGAVIKRTCRLGSLKIDPVTKAQIHIRNVDEMVAYASKKLGSESLEVIKVTAETVQNILEEFDVENMYLLGDTIPGTRMYHSFVPINDTKIAVRRYSASTQERQLQFLGSPMSKSCTYSVGEYVAAQILGSFAIGKVYSESEENGEYEIELMHRVGKGNAFRWPEIPNVQTFTFYEILLPVMPPVCKSDKTSTFGILPSELKSIRALVGK